MCEPPSPSIDVLANVSGVGPATVQAFRDLGFRTLADLEGATRDDLTQVPGVGDATAQAILDFLRSPASDDPVQAYRHSDRRPNNPPVGMAGYEPQVKERPQQHYAYDPHLSPQLIWAGKPGLRDIEVEDAAGVDVDTVSLHIHERVSAQAVVEAVQRPQPKQLELFSDPNLPLDQAVEFYQHDVDWANRLILGDSLLVMNSLLKREMMAGQVQMIYVDPPYGVKFSSNFQPRIDQRSVRDGDNYLTREPEQIKAYRDTWTLGIHSYLTYLRDRLRLCRDLLTASGSIFVQISDENIHRVRMLMDEVFGAENFCAQITFFKTTSQTSKLLASTSDYLLWYARDKEAVKYRQLFWPKTIETDSAGVYTWVELPDGSRRRMTREEKLSPGLLPNRAKIFRLDNMTSQSGSETTAFPVELDGRTLTPGRGYWKTNAEGMQRLIEARRVVPSGSTLAYVRYIDDFPVYPIADYWGDTGTGSFTDPKIYVVQTGNKVIERCLLMTTDPGDLVLDPTCGSGTTAYVAEQWGRRWITCDTSRVAVSLARQRLLTATFPYYKLYDENMGVKAGFVFTTVPHIMLGGIARNARLDSVIERYEPRLEDALAELNQALGASLKPWEVPFEPASDWSAEAVRRHREYLAIRQAKQREIDAIIATDAPQETLYDQPEEVSGVTRVSGPFTVEAIPPAAEELVAETPIGGAPEPDVDGDGREPILPPAGESGSHIPLLIDLMRQDGVTFPGNRSMTFESLTPRNSGVLHAEGVPAQASENGLQRVAVSFGPQYGPVSQRQVEQGLREAYMAGFDAVIFAGFEFDGPAQAAIEKGIHPHVKTFLAHIRPDVLLTDATGDSLLKTTAQSQLFSVFGEPDVNLQQEAGEYVVELRGVDVYDPIAGQVHSASAGQIAAWFLDTDYDGRTFCIVQAFFPNKSAWRNIERALRGTLNEERFDMLTGRVSLPFEAGEYQRVAVKVIDQRGNEVMRVLPLGEVAY